MAGTVSAAERIMAAVACSEGRQRLELAAELDLPLGTITSVTSSLVKDGKLEERAAAAALHPRRGRPAVVLVHPGPTRTVGVVVWSYGQMQSAIVTYGGRIVQVTSIPVEPTAVGDTTDLNTAVDFASGAHLTNRLDVARPDRVVIGVPAPYQRGVGLPGPPPPLLDDSSTRPRFAQWLRTDPAGLLSERLGLPVHIENDANLGALGEAHFGAGRAHPNMLYIKMGARTIGGGLVLDGRLYRGAAGYAGELAHIHIDDDGALCVCGSRGCLSRRLGQTLIDAVQPAYDEPVNFGTVRDLAAAGDPGPIRVLKDLGRTIGRPMADLCTFLNPSAIILDATLGAAGTSIAVGISEQIEKFAAPTAAAAVCVIAGELDNADISGAVALGRMEALAG